MGCFEMVGTVTACLHIARNWLEAKVCGNILCAACVFVRVLHRPQAEI